MGSYMYINVIHNCKDVFMFKRKLNTNGLQKFCHFVIGFNIILTLNILTHTLANFASSKDMTRI